MGKYLKKFSDHETYTEEFLDSPSKVLPNVSICETEKHVHYNPLEEWVNVTVTYMNGDTVYETDTKRVKKGQSASFSAAEEPRQWNEHQFFGWAPDEFPTYEQTQQQGYLKNPADSFSSPNNITLYAVYKVTFQGLIDEGYVRTDRTPSTSPVGRTLTVLPNHYPKEFVTDFMDVFEGRKCVALIDNKDTVVPVAITGDPQTEHFPSPFYFKDYDPNTWNYWLTPNEWYELYNNALLPHYIISNQFYGMDWAGKNSVTIKYRGNNNADYRYCTAERAYGPKMPKVLNVDIGNAYLSNMIKVFAQDGSLQPAHTGCGSETINLSRANGGKVTALNQKTWPQGFNALFEGCVNLKNVNGLETNNVTSWGYTFDGCLSIEVIATNSFGNVIFVADDFTQGFTNCQNLVTIEPELNVTNATNVWAAFVGCENLVNIELKGINAAKNAAAKNDSIYNQTAGTTWDFADTKLSQSSANYMIDELTPFTPPAGYTLKVINFPSGVSLDNLQLEKLRDNGWEAWINGEPQIIAI